MAWEWLFFASLLILGLLPFLSKARQARVPRRRVIVGAAAIAILGTAAGWQTHLLRRERDEERRLKHVPRTEKQEEYVTSQTCQSCHPREYESWHRSFHRTMTQYASTDTVVADFDNVPLEARGEKYLLQRRGKELWVEMPDPDWKAEQSRRRRLTDWSSLTNAPRVQKPVSMVTGSHHLQKFWVSSASGNLQYDLPFTYLIEDKKWVLREDSIVRDPALPLLIQIWNMNCIKCHTTAAQPRRDAKSGLLDTQVAEMGISCEACHGPAHDHVASHREPIRRYQARFQSKPDSTIVNPARQSPKTGSQICGQCHAIKFNLEQDWEQHGSGFRPGQDLDKSMVVVLPTRPAPLPGLAEALQDSDVVTHFFWPDGMTKITGREYNSLVQSACHERGEMSCMSCHSIHKSDPNDQLAAGMEGNQACLQCHDSYREKIQEHTRHRADSSGSLCYNCHMPHTSWGLLGAVRSHQITSPSVQVTKKTGRPNACNLCHLDQSLAWTGKYLSEWFGHSPPALAEDEAEISAALLWLLKGDAGQRALMAWSMGWEAARQASGQRWMAPFLSQLLDDPYAAVRYRAHRSLKQIPGFENFAYDYVGSAADRSQARQRALEIWSKTSVTDLDRTGASVLIQETGGLFLQEFDRLLRQRDDRSVFLVE